MHVPDTWIDDTTFVRHKTKNKPRRVNLNRIDLVLEVEFACAEWIFQYVPPETDRY